MDDLSLVKGLAAGKEKAYEILYETHYRVLCLYANKFVKDSDIAEHLVSDVIYYIWENRTDINITTSLRNYLIQAVKNRCYNYIKQEERKRDVYDEWYHSKHDSSAYSFNQEQEDPLEILLLKELDLKIKNILAKLPETTRKVFLLSRFSGHKYAEIAEKTNLSVDSVKYHIKSALSILRKNCFIIYILQVLTFFS